MTSSAYGLSGFMSFRTPNTIRPMDASLVKPKVPCKQCGATLRHSNPGPLCCQCIGPVDIPEWAITTIELDGRPSTVLTIAGILTGEGTQRQIKRRNEDIRAQLEAGLATKQELATAHGLGWQQIDAIANRKQSHKSAHN